jgi:hypothetical protein
MSRQSYSVAVTTNYTAGVAGHRHATEDFQLSLRVRGMKSRQIKIFVVCVSTDEGICWDVLLLSYCFRAWLIMFSISSLCSLKEIASLMELTGCMCVRSAFKQFDSAFGRFSRNFVRMAQHWKPHSVVLFNQYTCFVVKTGVSFSGVQGTMTVKLFIASFGMAGRWARRTE